METLWIGGPDDVRRGDSALDAIRVENDAHYFSDELGSVKVTQQRWRRAQEYEANGWLRCWSDQQDDRSAEHFEIFKGYQDLKSDLGHVCEIGCGPFTQLKTIIKGRTATRVTLLDPLLRSYQGLKHCPYRKNSFAGIQTSLRQEMAESLTDFAVFDTIVCINVLEHVMDAFLVLDNLKRSLKAGGTIVFGERAYPDFDPHFTFDAGHPIHVKGKVLDDFKSNFNVIYSNNHYFIGTR